MLDSPFLWSWLLMVLHSGRFLTRLVAQYMRLFFERGNIRENMMVESDWQPSKEPSYIDVCFLFSGPGSQNTTFQKLWKLRQIIIIVQSTNDSDGGMYSPFGRVCAGLQAKTRMHQRHYASFAFSTATVYMQGKFSITIQKSDTAPLT